MRIPRFQSSFGVVAVPNSWNAATPADQQQGNCPCECRVSPAGGCPSSIVAGDAVTSRRTWDPRRWECNIFFRMHASSISRCVKILIYELLSAPWLSINEYDYVLAIIKLYLTLYRLSYIFSLGRVKVSSVLCAIPCFQSYFSVVAVPSGKGNVPPCNVHVALVAWLCRLVEFVDVFKLHGKIVHVFVHIFRASNHRWIHKRHLEGG